MLESVIRSCPTTLSPAARELLPELNEHLGAYGVLVHQYCKHFALSGDLKPGAIRHAMHKHSLQTFHHMRQIGVCISRLGGVPVGSMIELVNQAYLEPEPEGAHSWSKMLGHDLELEVLNNSRLALTEETAGELADWRTAGVLARLVAAGGERRARLEAVVHDVRGG